MVVLREQDVGGLDVAVHEPGGVRGVEGRGDLHHDRRGLADAERPRAPQPRGEVLPADVAHDDVGHAVVLAGAVDRDDVRMLDRRRQA
jgi:hypothetical protein